MNHLLYALTALALLCVFVLDPNFAANLTRVLDDSPATTPLGFWEVAIAGILAALIVAAFFRERRR